MVRKFIKLISFLIILSIFIPMTSLANRTLVYDDAMLFSASEISNLEEEANVLSDLYNMDIVIVTTNDATGKTPRDYADDFYDYNGLGVGSDYDGILFLIDMDNREPHISTSGIGIRYLTDNRIESLIDGVFDDGLVEGDYYGAAMSFLNNTGYYLESGIPSDQYNEPEEPRKKSLSPLDFLISFFGSGSAAGAFFLSIKNKYKVKEARNVFSYRNNSIVNLRSNEDKLLDTSVTHRIIPVATNNSSSTSGKSTTHTSSSGRTHGGGGSGGRKF